MSRIGRKPVKLPSGVEYKQVGQTITLKGQKGELSLELHNAIEVEKDDSFLNIKLVSDKRQHKPLCGLYRSLINNIVTGITDGYEKKLVLSGVGYRVQLKGSDLELSLGYSHPVVFKALDGVTFNVDGQTTIIVSSTDKVKLGQVCQDIKSLRKKDPYKAKGIHYDYETPKKKPGKSVKK